MADGTTFAERMAQALAANEGMEKGDIAAGLGVRPGTVSPWFSGKSLPSAEQMMRLPDLLHVSGHWLLTGELPMRLADPGQEAKAFRRIARYVDAVRARENPRARAADDRFTEAVEAGEKAAAEDRARATKEGQRRPAAGESATGGGSG